MGTYKLKIVVKEHANNYTQWGETDARIRIYRSTTGLQADATLHDTISMAPHAGEDTVTYEYDDTSGADGYAAWFTFYDDGSGEESGYSPEALVYGTSGTYYVSVSDLRDEGLPSTVSDARAVTLIQRAEALVEDYTGNFFREISGTFVFDGNNSHLLHLPLPIIEVTSLTINEMSSVLDTQFYQVFNGRTPPNDDRRNPKIVLKNVNTESPIYSFGNIDKFMKGLDQTVVGKFGYLEADDTVPILVQEAVIALALLQSDDTLYNKMIGMSNTMGPKIRERTDDHEIQWADLSRRHGRVSMPIWVQNKLARYMRPRKFAVPNVRHGSFR